MRLQYTYEESDCYEYDPEATYIGGAPPTRTEGIPVGWKKGSFAEQDGLDLSSFNVRNRRYNNKAGNTNLSDINNWNSGYWQPYWLHPSTQSVVVTIGEPFQHKNASSVLWVRVARSTTLNGNQPPN